MAKLVLRFILLIIYNFKPLDQAQFYTQIL